MYEITRNAAGAGVKSSAILAVDGSIRHKRRMENILAIRAGQRVKRWLDILICTAALPLALPLGLCLMALIVLDSRGAPIYRHERIGKGGKPFQIYKFRTMRANADAILQECLAADPALADEWQRDQKLRNDPRLTRVGRLLRKTSLDELPQIINILLGDMTLVGPRPIVASEKRKYGRYFEEYCGVRPGLTGLWQTSGRNDTTYSQRVVFDHYYINHWSVWLDFWIMAKTIPVALSGRGAY